MRVLKFLVIAVLSVIATSSLQAQNDALIGTWKLNTAKSKYEPGPTPKSLTRIVEAQNDGVKYTFEGIAADGTPISYTFSVKFDGNDNPITGTVPNGADTASMKRVDANHYVATLKKGGKPLGTSKVSISKDGKVATVEASGTNAAGVKTHDLQVYDKQ
jgi:hypothetical protein